jgi:hypothetical protein
MRIWRALAALLLLCALAVPARAATTLLPQPESCFSATTGVNGMVGVLGTIVPGTGGTAGTYGGVALTGGSGTGATANIVVSAGGVTTVTILNPGKNYVVADSLSASSANIGGTTGFSVPVSSISINGSLAGGSINTYIPSTTTPKSTWKDAGQVTLNANPIPLDANGCAIIYGTGSYRFQVLDSLGNLVYDQVTTDTSFQQTGCFWAGTAGGTPNAITVTDAGFNASDGQCIQFVALATNTAATTLNPSAYGAISVVQDTSTGPVALTSGTIVQNNLVSVVYSVASNSFHLVSIPPGTTANLANPTPQGYLNVVGAANGSIYQTTDVSASTSVYYSPATGSQVPIWNGSAYVNFRFSELTLTLTGSHLGDTLYDACVFSNNGVAAIVSMPAWSSSAAGSSSRGTGAGTPQLSRLQGLWVNTVQISAINGANTYTVPLNQCTYVGTFYTDHTAGQVSSYVTWGQNRKHGTWNAYNKAPIIVKAGDSTATWTYTTATLRASNNVPSSFSSTVCNTGSGTSCNGITIIEGLAEDPIDITSQQVVLNNGAVFVTDVSPAIGFNSVTAATGTQAQAGVGGSNKITANARYVAPPSLGINVGISLEYSGASNTTTWYGTELNMLLTAQYRG